MEVITYKCPNCGGDLTFDPASGKYKCEYCLSSFTQEEAERANPKAAEALNGEDDAAGAQEASDAQKESSTEETKGETEQGEAVVYTCPNCGAEIVTDATTAATYCFYCHNPVVLSGRSRENICRISCCRLRSARSRQSRNFCHLRGRNALFRRTFSKRVRYRR